MWGGIFVGEEMYAKGTQPQRPTISLDIFAQPEQSNATLGGLSYSLRFFEVAQERVGFFTAFCMQKDCLILLL